MHSGIININSFPAKRFEGVELTCKVIKPKKNYVGSFKNGIMSRSIKAYAGNALKPEGIRHLTNLGPMESLERYAANMHIPIGKNRIKPKPKNISNIVPIPETHIVFNMNNEPAYKYSIFNIADKGFEKNEFMIKKLDNYVLYLETDKQEKYELLKSNTPLNSEVDLDVFDVFRFSRVKHPERIDNDYFCSNKPPLADDQIEVIYPNLEWEEILWGNTSILIQGERRVEGLRSFKYYKREKETNK